MSAMPSGAAAEEACVDAWLTRDDGSREYLPGLGPHNCVETGLDRSVHAWDEFTDPDFPINGYKGAGFDAWVTTGPVP